MLHAKAADKSHHLSCQGIGAEVEADWPSRTSRLYSWPASADLPGGILPASHQWHS